MNDENDEIVPKKQSLFSLTPNDIVDNALQNLDEKQVREVTQKAADEVVKIAIEKRRAEYRSNAAREEMQNVVDNANILDKTVSEYKINSTFETASGTTSVEIQNSKPNQTLIVVAAFGLLMAIAILAFLFLR